ncbi:L-arabinolactonase [Tsuneonella dongtanensis]|uniref:L-arabinolactonase n=1 Tax=Tsuneonella dongtanensis TaxID=692370 RepID=A0A1B2AAV0_9SPHN|nr:SMP-30/gluconolactonase/LRE family protein [Tsuneonella dongtanensis]ANY19289.1 L-arabinolactonase [Tsuneonella dongtanensis]
MSEHTVEPIAVANCLGEGVVWDDRAQEFIWTDIHARLLYRLEWKEHALHQHALPHRLGSLALTEEAGVIVGAFSQGFARYEIASGALEWLAQPEAVPGVRFNDGRVDREGRFVAGTMVEDAAAAGGSHLGTLWRLERDRSLTPLVENIAITNALCWSPDGATMYHTDTTTGTLNAYRYGERAEFHRVVRQFTAEEGWPDGACVDAAGNIWVALWGGSRVICLDPATGRETQNVALPALQPTCPAFGGPDLDVLAITSAWSDLARSPEEADPHAGDMFLAHPGARGLPEMRVSLG